MARVLLWRMIMVGSIELPLGDLPILSLSCLAPTTEKKNFPCSTFQKHKTLEEAGILRTEIIALRKTSQEQTYQFGRCLLHRKIVGIRGLSIKEIEHCYICELLWRSTVKKPRDKKNEREIWACQNDPMSQHRRGLREISQLPEKGDRGRVRLVAGATGGFTVF